MRMIKARQWSIFFLPYLEKLKKQFNIFIGLNLGVIYKKNAQIQ